MSKTTSSPQYGHRTIGTADELGLDADGGKWVVICEDHKSLVNVTTQKDARSSATADFCDGCRNATEEPAEASEFAADTTKDWRGNYNTVFAPAAELIAAASGVEARTINVSAMLKQTAIAGTTATDLLTLLSEIEEQAVAALKSWQKTQDRSGQTDMEKFNQNRSFLAGYLGATAQRLSGAKKTPVVQFAADMDKALRPEALKAGAAARKTTKVAA